LPGDRLSADSSRWWRVPYTDVRKSAGITFLQDATQTEEKYYLETMGTGVAWLDHDQDGRMDLFFVQSAATDIYQPTRPLRCELYHNNGDATFTEVTDQAGQGHYGQGVAVGDFDNDGYPDLYVTGYGRAILYPNNGDGTFTDVTARAGVADQGGWSTSAGWFDYDKDGWLDLAVTNYIAWTPENNLWCGERRPGYRSYRNPGNYQGAKTKLIGTKCNRTAIRARVRVVTGKHTQMDEVHSQSSVMSQCDLRLHFALGRTQTADLIEVPSPTTGKIEKFTQVKAHQILTIREGRGIIDTFRPETR
jgi:FG-GAP-like repeat/ASPIC and UnbV